MKILAEWGRRLGYLATRRRRDAELRADMEAHRAMMAQPARFGSGLRLREEARDVWGWRWLDDLSQDVAIASRTLRRSRGFAAAVIGTLAVGIGANAAIFNVVYHVLLKPIPYERPDRLVVVTSVVPQLQGRFPLLAVPAPDFDEYQRSNVVFSDMAAMQATAFSLTGHGDPQWLDGARVSAGFFSMVGVAAARGRTFAAAEDLEGSDRVVVVSHDLWTTKFAADPGIVGRTLVLDGQPLTVIGVMPAKFLFPSGKQLGSLAVFGSHVDVWKPMGFTRAQLRSEGSFDYAVIARLRDGVSIQEAGQNLDALAQNNVQRIKRQAPGIDYDLRVRLVPLRDVISGNVRPLLLILLAAVGLLLVIACVNLANLFLARTTRRVREFATRSALGASRGRLMRQLMTEGLLIAGLGAAAGALLGVWLGRVLVWLGPPDSAVRAGTWDGPVVAFIVAITIAVGAVLGMLPAIEVFRRNVQPRISAVPGGRRHTLRAALVSLQVTLCVALVAAAALLLQSFFNVVRVDKGFAAERVLAIDLALPTPAYSRPQIVEFYRALVDRVAALPGVTRAGAVSRLPLAHEGNIRSVLLETDLEDRLDRPAALFRSVAGDLFAALDVPLVAGRAFNEPEPAPVVIVSLGLARALWPTDPPSAVVGRRVRLGEVRNPLATIVGVAGDVRATGLDRDAQPAFYRPQSQTPSPNMSVVVRTATPPESLGDAIRGALGDLDANLAIAAMRTMDEVVSTAMAPRRFQLVLLGAFAAVALVLAVVGIYGVTSYVVAARTREIGIRIALGSRPSSVVGSVLVEGLKPVLCGLLMGLVAASFAAIAIRATLFGVEPIAPWVFASVAAVVVASGTAACYVPARRAGAVDPATTLRCE